MSSTNELSAKQYCCTLFELTCETIACHIKQKKLTKTPGHTKNHSAKETERHLATQANNQGVPTCFMSPGPKRVSAETDFDMKL